MANIESWDHTKGADDNDDCLVLAGGAKVKRQCKHGRPHQLFLPSSFWDKITSMLIPDYRDDDKNNAVTDDIDDHDDQGN